MGRLHEALLCILWVRSLSQEPLNVKLKLLRPISYPNMTLFCEAPSVDPYTTLYTFYLNDIDVQRGTGQEQRYLYQFVLRPGTSGRYQCSVNADDGANGYSNFLRVGTKIDNRLPSELHADDNSLGRFELGSGRNDVTFTTPRTPATSTQTEASDEYERPKVDVPLQVNITASSIYDDAISLRCRAFMVDPDRSYYTFYHNDSLVQEGAGAQGLDQYVFDVTGDTTGWYKCAAQSQFGPTGMSERFWVDDALISRMNSGGNSEIQPESKPTGSTTATVGASPTTVRTTTASPTTAATQQTTPLRSTVLEVIIDEPARNTTSPTNTKPPESNSDDRLRTRSSEQQTGASLENSQVAEYDDSPDKTRTGSSESQTLADLQQVEDGEVKVVVEEADPLRLPFRQYVVPEVINVSLYLSRPINPQNLTLICDSNYKSAFNEFTFFRDDRIIQRGTERAGYHMYTFVLNELTKGQFHCTVDNGNGLFRSNSLRISYRRRPPVTTTVSPRYEVSTAYEVHFPTSRSYSYDKLPANTVETSTIEPTLTGRPFERERQTIPSPVTTVQPSSKPSGDQDVTIMVLRTANMSRHQIHSEFILDEPQKTDLLVEQDSGTVLLTCVVDPDLPYVAWYRNGEPFFNPADRHEQIQFEITQFTAGMYQCKAFRNPKAVQVSNVVRIEAPRAFPPFLDDDPNVTILEMVKYQLAIDGNYTQTEVLLGCHNSHELQEPVYRFFRNGKMLATAPHAPWIRFDLKPDRTGTYRCESKEKRESTWTESNVVHV